MRDLLIVTAVVLASLTQLNAHNGDPLLSPLAETIIDVKRPILIYDSSGEKIFSSKARIGERISEVNMNQVKDGVYVIETSTNNYTIRFRFLKEVGGLQRSEIKKVKEAVFILKTASFFVHTSLLVNANTLLGLL